MSGVDQLVVAAAPGDAVTTSAFEFRDLLRQGGDSQIYARFIHPALADEVRPMEQLPTGGADAVLLFHASIGDAEVFPLVRSRAGRLVVMYHNISPPEQYARYPEFARLLESGRADLASLADRTTFALAPSRFNADELRAMGFGDVRVSPLVVDVDALRARPRDEAVAARLAADDRPLLLAVGQLLPHKAQEDLVKAFHVLKTYLRPEVQLAIVGPSRLPGYRERLEAFVGELALDGLHLVGEVSDAALASYYGRADVFVSASTHEGFCVPLLEAMSFEVPVVARAAGAVPEILQGAGLVLPPSGGARLFAEAVDHVLSDEPLRTTLQERGRHRLRDFRVADARQAFLDHLAGL